MRPTSGYRDRVSALQARRDEHARRLCALDSDARSSVSRSLSRRQHERLTSLRERAQPEDDSAEALSRAEDAIESCEQLLDEELGLHAELHKLLDSILPARAALLRWAGFASVSLLLLLLVVHQLHLGSFMMAAIGMKVERPTIEPGVGAVIDAHTLRRIAATRRCAPYGVDPAFRCQLPDEPDGPSLPYLIGAGPSR